MKPSKRIKEKDGYGFMYRPLWLCDRKKRIDDGKCDGVGCFMGVCVFTTCKKHAVVKKTKIRGKWKKVSMGIPLLKVRLEEGETK